MSARLTIGEQIGLILGLRWRLFRNSLRTLRGRLDAAGLVLLWLLMSGLMLGGGFAIALGAYFFVAHHHPARFAELFWAVFLFWQFYPFLSGLGGAPFEFTNLLRFPLRYGAFFTLSLAYGLLDPSAVISLFWLVCLSAGVGFARIELLPWALLLSLVFAAMNLSLARAVSTWADRWLGQRRTREILGILVVVVVLTVQFVGPLLFESGEARGWLASLLATTHALPPEVAAKALASSVIGAPLNALAGFLFVCLYGLAFFWLLHARLTAQYRGENLGEGRAAGAPAGHARASESAAAWRLPLRSRPTAALFEREARYTLRNWPVLLQLGFPVFFLLVGGAGFRHQPFFLRHGDMIFPIFVGYAFLSEMNWVFNSLGYDGDGVRFLLLAPVRFRQIMLGKNLVTALATLGEVVALWICTRWTFGPLRPVVVAATLAASAYALLVNVAVGNFISVSFPIRRTFGAFRRSQGMRGTAMLAGLGTEAAVVGSSLALFLAGELLHRLDLAVIMFLALAVLAAAGYAISLTKIDRFALHHRESLIEELSQAEGAS